MLSFKEKINIVVVGANDGAINDPIYEFVRAFPKRSRIILVEPQEYLISFLKENYGFHPENYIFNGAIGPGESLTLYRVDKACWDFLKVSYAKDWPSYRAPSGVTSSNPEHVERWLRNHLAEGNPGSYLQRTTVSSLKLLGLLDEAKLFSEVDVLQIDTEGFDDQVIYNSEIEKTKPRIIYFEAKALSEAKWKAVRSHLEIHNYTTSRHGQDALAIRTT
jgi:FkbM family methyltransferase